MPSLLTTDEIREHIETDLADTALQRLIDDAEAEIIQRYGAHAEGGTVTEQHVVRSGERWIYPRRDVDVGAGIVVTRQHLGSSDVTTAEASEYVVDTGGAIRLLATGPWSDQLVTITYTPPTDAPRRKRVLVDLVRIAVRYDALSSSSLGDVSVSHLGYEQERSRVLSRLSSFASGFA